MLSLLDQGKRMVKSTPDGLLAWPSGCCKTTFASLFSQGLLQLQCLTRRCGCLHGRTCRSGLSVGLPEVAEKIFTKETRSQTLLLTSTERRKKSNVQKKIVL